MNRVKAHENIDRKTLEMIARSLGPIHSMVLHIGDVNLDAGAGVIDDWTKCLWTNDRRRIEISMAFGGLIGSISNGPDPECPVLPEAP